MPGIYPSGAVYNHYLAKQMNLPIEDLKQVIQEWGGKSLVGKVLSCLNPFVDPEMRAAAARDLVAAREDPTGEVAQKINWKLDAYRAEKALKQ